MDFQEVLKNYSPIVKKNMVGVGFGIVGLIFLGYGLTGLFGSSKSSSDAFIFESDSASGSSSSSTESLNLKSMDYITIDIEGAVIMPGVYELPFNSRIRDALIVSKGMSESADREWVVRNLNLAQKLVDGSKIYIPKTEENIKDGMYVGGSQENLLKAQINVNTASIKELDQLPGVGLVTAQKIIDARPYTAIDDLLSKKVVNSRVFEQIKEKITVY